MIQITIDPWDGTIGEILDLLHIPAVKIDRWDESYPHQKTSFDNSDKNYRNKSFQKSITSQEDNYGAYGCLGSGDEAGV